MNCSQCQDLLQLQLDGDPVADRSPLDQHLQTCPDCRGLFAAAARLEEGLSLFTIPAPPRDFAAAVVGAVLDDQRLRRRTRRRWFAGAALAASLLLAVALKFTTGRPEPAVVQPTTQYFPVAATHPAKESAPPSPIELVSQSSSVVAALPRRIVQEAAAVPRLSLPADVLPELPPMGAETAEPALEQATASLNEARQGMSLAWQAVESPVRRATGVWSRMTPSLQKQ
jgi:hypothetical protein